MSAAKPTLEDLVRMVCKVKARMAKELIGISVTIQSYPLDPPAKPEKPIKVRIAKVKQS